MTDNERLVPSESGGCKGWGFVVRKEKENETDD